MFISRNYTNLTGLLVFALLAGCASSAQTAQDKEFNASLIELMEEMSTRLAEKDQTKKEERLILKYTNKSSQIELELDPNEDDFYLDLSGISPVVNDTVYIREPDSSSGTPENGKSTSQNRNLNGEDNPEDSDIRIRQVLSKYRRAQDLFYLEEYSRALDLLNETLDIAETADTYALKGTIHFMLGNRNATRQNWNRAVELNPDMPLPNIPELQDIIQDIKAGE